MTRPGSPESEGRFTTPTDLCPYPERWTSTDGDSTEVEVSDLAWGLVRALQPSYCVETGAGWGQTTWRIGDALARNGHGVLEAIERDPEHLAQLRADALWFSRHPVEIVAADSLEWVPEEIIDFAWLDSWYETRVPEFHRYRAWMHPGTVVCFHDSAPGHGGHRIQSGRDLRSEIEAELVDYLRVVHLPTPRGVTIAEVR